MEKIKLFLDFDGTIANSNKAICDYYNYHYNDREGFVMADWTKVKEWNYTDQCPLFEEGAVKKYFSSANFFKSLEPMEGAIDTIKTLQDYFKIIIVTIGTQQNIQHKTKWINKYFPDIETIYIFNGQECIMDKSIIDMWEGVLIDDALGNLESSNASIRIIFGEETSFNKTNDPEYQRLVNWQEVLYFMLIVNKTLTEVNIFESDDEDNEQWKTIRDSISEVM